MATIHNGIIVEHFDDDQIADFYQGRTQFEAKENDYLIIDFQSVNGGKALIGPYIKKGDSWQEVQYKTFTSQHFGEIKPKNKDPYQMAYIDSICRNQITFCTGPAGSGKTMLALGYGFQELEKGKISKIVIFANPLIAAGSVKLGFLPGTKEDKILETSIGNILISKIGSRTEVERLLEEEQIEIIPMGDCRGYEVPENSFVYFTEAQNLSPYLMKLFLQRTNDNCKIVIEGDIKQADSELFDGENSGLAKAIEVFRGENYAGCVELKNIYRGKIAQRAELII